MQEDLGIIQTVLAALGLYVNLSKSTDSSVYRSSVGHPKGANVDAGFHQDSCPKNLHGTASTWSDGLYDIWDSSCEAENASPTAVFCVAFQTPSTSTISPSLNTLGDCGISSLVWTICSAVCPFNQIVVTTDTLLWGRGVHCEDSQVQGKWSGSQKLQHNSCLEFLVVHLALKPVLLGKVVLHVLDKQGGSASMKLCNLMVTLWTWCLQHNVFLVAVHVPGVDNVCVDRLSLQGLDEMEWSLNVKCLLSAANVKCPNFSKGVPHQTNLWGCFSSDLVGDTILHVFSVSIASSSSTKTYSRQDTLSSCDAMVAMTAMVSTSNVVVTEGICTSSDSTQLPIPTEWQDSARRPRL